MVRNYKRTTTRQSWSEAAMASAVEAVKKGDMGIKNASRVFNVPKTTLRRRAREKNKRASGSRKDLGGRAPVLNEEVEADLVNYIVQMEEMFFGLRMEDVRGLAHQVAERNGMLPPNDSRNSFGKDWLKGFLTRHPEITPRTPEATSAARARGFNREIVRQFFDMYETVTDNYQFPPQNIYNVDETGITTVQGNAGKVLAMKGRRQVGCLTSGERGQLVTVVVCMNVTGTFIPPLFIFPRKRMKAELMDGSPPGSICVCHPSGWMQMDIFGQWFDHFLTVSGASKLNPVLLLLDGHSTHVRNLSVINKARDNGVVIICLPPHCSHKMQPLDVSFMKPLSTYYNTEVTKWLRNHPGRTVSVFQLAQLLTPAFQKAATAQTAANGFRKTGLWPVNRDIFEDHEFAPSEPTNMPLSESPSISSSVPSHEPLESMPPQAVLQPELIEQPLPEPSFCSSPAAQEASNSTVEPEPTACPASTSGHSLSKHMFGSDASFCSLFCICFLKLEAPKLI